MTNPTRRKLLRERKFNQKGIEASLADGHIRDLKRKALEARQLRTEMLTTHKLRRGIESEMVHERI